MAKCIKVFQVDETMYAKSINGIWYSRTLYKDRYYNTWQWTKWKREGKLESIHHSHTTFINDSIELMQDAIQHSFNLFLKFSENKLEHNIIISHKSRILQSKESNYRLPN